MPGIVDILVLLDFQKSAWFSFLCFILLDIIIYTQTMQQQPMEVGDDEVHNGTTELQLVESPAHQSCWL